MNRSPLFYHRDAEYLECLGCGAQIEVPHQIAHAPEERAMWLEPIERMHAGCGAVRLPAWPRGEDGRIEPVAKAARVAT